MRNACIIGVSGFGNVHYGDLMREVAEGRMRALGATVINQEEEAEKCARLREVGCELFTDYRRMLERFRGQIDLCFVPTGIHLHAPMTIEALRAGANVFVEKPVAATVQEVNAMREAERASGRFVAVGYQSMYTADTRTMKRAIVEGRIGNLRALRCRCLWPRDDAYYARNSWAGKLRSGEQWVLDSPFNNAVAHQLNMLCFLAGQEVGSSARLQSVQAELYRGNRIESADTASIRIRTAGGVPLYFFVSHCSEGTFNPQIVVRGDRGEIVWNFEETRIADASGRVELLPSGGGDWNGARRAIMEHLHRRMEDPAGFICGLDIAGTQTLAANGAYDSSPIHDVPESLLRRVPHKDGQSMRTVIGGIDALVHRAFEEERLFSELDVYWARPGAVVDVSAYASFPTSEHMRAAGAVR